MVEHIFGRRRRVRREMHLERSCFFRSAHVQLAQLHERLRDIDLKRLIEHPLPRARRLECQQSRAWIPRHRMLARARADAAEWRGDVEECRGLLDELLRELEHYIVAGELDERAVRDALDVLPRGHAARK